MGDIYVRKVTFSLILPVSLFRTLDVWGEVHKYRYMYVHTHDHDTIKIKIKKSRSWHDHHVRPWCMNRLDHVQIQLISGCLYHCGKWTAKLTNQMWALPKCHRVWRVPLVSLVLCLSAQWNEQPEIDCTYQYWIFTPTLPAWASLH